MYLYRNGSDRIGWTALLCVAFLFIGLLFSALRVMTDFGLMDMIASISVLFWLGLGGLWPLKLCI